ncbi:sugar phosphate nucleotidyltransferase [Leifsonia sp. McL0607]|uniref:nucleotidyltransferase family protein n=1 Tax=Leifsonia sp. McL0607 TaxID=3415672 RepID=UPI003CEF820F
MEPRVAAVVLAAGRGARLAPLTDDTPKPLLSVGGRALVDHAIAKSRAAGARHVFVNAFHAAPALVAHLAEADDVTVRVEERLTGPAGALRLFESELQGFDAVLVVSGDTYFDDDLEPLVRSFRQFRSSLTIATVETDHAYRFGVLRVAEDGTVLEAEEKPNVEAHEKHQVSTGIYCLDPTAISLLPRQGTVDFVTDLVPAVWNAGGSVRTWPLRGSWSDVGTFATFLGANLKAARSAPGGHLVHADASVEAGVHLGGSTVIGAKATVGAGATLIDTVVLDGAVVPRCQVVVGGIISKGTTDHDAH